MHFSIIRIHFHISIFIFSYSDETSTINHQIECIDSNNAFWHPPHDMENNSYYSSGHPHSNQSRRASVSFIFF